MIRVKVTEAQISEAKEMRRERDKRYGNYFDPRDGDLPWAGDLAEIIVAEWFGRSGLQHEWLKEGDVRSTPDFLIGPVSLDVKQRKREDRVWQPWYTCQATAPQVDKIMETGYVNEFFFTSYCPKAKEMLLVGGIGFAAFMILSRRYESGERVHASYTVREKHAIYNIGSGHLLAPVEWLEQVRIVQEEGHGTVSELQS